MILLLLGLEFLALTNLLYLELLLLLLIFLVLLGIAGIWSGKLFRRRYILGMDCGAWARSLGGWTIGICVGMRSVDGRARSFVVGARGLCSWASRLGIRTSL